MKRILFASLLPVLLWGQTTVNGGRAILGTFNASGAASTQPAKTGSNLPVSCTQGEMFFKTDATAGQNLFLCTATNTWTQTPVGGGGGSPNASYLTLAADSGLTAERVLTPRDNLTASDGGAGASYLLDWTPMDRSTFWFVDDFAAGKSENGHIGYGWKTSAGGSGTVTAQGAGADADHPFVVVLDTGTTNPSDSSLYLGSLGDNLQGLTTRPWTAEWIFKLTASLTGGHFRAGFSTEPGMPQGDTGRSAFFLRHQQGTDTNWVVVRNNGGTLTPQCTASAGPILDTWYRLRMTGGGSGTIAVQLLNASGQDQFASCSGTMDSPGGGGMGPYFMLTSADTTQKKAILDWFGLKVRGLTR